MFHTQKIANNFPKNLRLREDPSSLGFKFFSSQGDFLSKYSKDLNRYSKNFLPVTSSTDMPSDVYVWDINDFEFEYENVHLNSNLKLPTVIGDDINIDVVRSLEELLYSVVTRISFIDNFIYDGVVYESFLNESGVIYDIKVPGRLSVEIDGVNRFYQTSTSQERSPKLIAVLVLEGEDDFGNVITDKFQLTYNGLYRTKNIYYKLTSVLIQNLESDTGTIKIKSLDFNISSFPSLYEEVITSEKSFEMLKTFNSDLFFLNYKIFDVQDFSRISEEQEIFCPFTLFDSENNQIEITDITFSEDCEILYVLSNDKIHVFKDWIPPIMNAPLNERTMETIVTIEPYTFFPALNSEFIFHIFSRSIIKRVKSVNIKIIDPDGDEFYINENLEISSNEFTFLGDPTTNWPGDTFNDKKASFVPDKIGQWEVVVTTIDTNDKIYIDVVNIFVPFLIADKTIELSEEYESVAYGSDGHIYLYNGSESHKYQLFFDYCLIDSKNTILFSIENYDTLEVNYV